MTTSLPDATWKRKFRQRLRAWFERGARDLPWRRSRDPYGVWVSEIMLQQTQVATVVPYFERFLAAFPTVQALAAADEEQVLRLWEGLGYYRRARQMHAAAKAIVEHHGGRFPRDRSAVQALPGIGRYTAGAILSIAFDARQPILEANTIRLLSRLLAYRGDPQRADGQKLLWRFAEELLPRSRPGAFNQAMMELGSEICKPRQPHCDRCPAASLCATRELGLQAVIPRAKKKTHYEQLHEACVVIWRDDQILLRRCGQDERWSGLWDFPRFPIRSTHEASLKKELADQVARQTGVCIEPGVALATLKHGVTRFRITLSCYEAAYVKGGGRKSDQRWVRPNQLAEYPLSVTGRKISKTIA